MNRKKDAIFPSYVEVVKYEPGRACVDVKVPNRNNIVKNVPVVGKAGKYNMLPMMNLHNDASCPVVIGPRAPDIELSLDWLVDLAFNWRIKYGSFGRGMYAAESSYAENLPFDLEKDEVVFDQYYIAYGWFGRPLFDNRYYDYEGTFLRAHNNRLYCLIYDVYLNKFIFASCLISPDAGSDMIYAFTMVQDPYDPKKYNKTPAYISVKEPSPTLNNMVIHSILNGYGYFYYVQPDSSSRILQYDTSSMEVNWNIAYPSGIGTLKEIMASKTSKDNIITLFTKESQWVYKLTEVSLTGTVGAYHLINFNNSAWTFPYGDGIVEQNYPSDISMTMANTGSQNVDIAQTFVPAAPSFVRELIGYNHVQHSKKWSLIRYDSDGVLSFADYYIPLCVDGDSLIVFCYKHRKEIFAGTGKKIDAWQTMTTAYMSILPPQSFQIRRSARTQAEIFTFSEDFTSEVEVKKEYYYQSINLLNGSVTKEVRATDSAITTDPIFVVTTGFTPSSSATFTFTGPVDYSQLSNNWSDYGITGSPWIAVNTEGTCTEWFGGGVAIAPLPPGTYPGGNHRNIGIHTYSPETTPHQVYAMSANTGPGSGMSDIWAEIGQYEWNGEMRNGNWGLVGVDNVPTWQDCTRTVYVSVFALNPVGTNYGVRKIYTLPPWITNNTHNKVVIDQKNHIMIIPPAEWKAQGSGGWEGLVAYSTENFKQLWKKDTFMIAGEYFVSATVTSDQVVVFVNNDTATQGYSGYSGYGGISGYSGFSGVSGYSGIYGISGFSGWSGYSGGVDPNRRVSSKIYVFSTKTGKKVFEGFGYPTLTPGSSISMGFPDGSVVYPTSAYYKISGNEYRTNTGIAIIAENLKKK